MVNNALNGSVTEQLLSESQSPLAGEALPCGPGSRVLFQVRNRRGLGHMMRGLNISRELRALDADADILFYLRTPPAEGMWNPAFRQIVESDPEGLTHWPEILRQFHPHAVVYDTMLPKVPAEEPVIAGARYVYIMRKCLEEKQREVFANAFLDRMDAIIVPHMPEQFGYELPGSIRSRTHYVGPIVRLPDAEGQAALRRKYDLTDRDFLLTSTVGGGGFEAQADAFFAVVFEIHERVRAAIPDLRHIVVKGPNYAKALAGAPGMTLVDFEPQMMNLLAISDLVVAEGGYNTVNEIRINKTPAIFLPSERGNDNQEERVRALERQGLGVVFTDLDARAIAAKITDLHRDRQQLQSMRDHYRADLVRLGNREAARLIRELIP